MKHGNPYEFEDGGAEKRGLVWMVITIIFALALAIAICWIDRQNAAMAQVMEDSRQSETYSESYSPGQPLDRVRMTAPDWSTAKYMYMIAHRGSGACWMYVELDGKWQVLPVCEGMSYAAQQTGEE